jgi:hypothetical protein
LRKVKAALPARAAPRVRLALSPTNSADGLAARRSAESAVPAQERRAAEAQDQRQARDQRQHAAQAADAGHDQARVGGGAEQHDRQHVLALQALAKDEHVLGADGDDQAGGEDEALEEGGEKECRSCRLDVVDDYGVVH